MRTLIKYALVVGALLVAFAVGRSQSPPTWQVASKDVLPDGINIMEVHNTLTNDAYVIAWTSASISIVPKSQPTGLSLTPPNLPPPPSASRQH